MEVCVCVCKRVLCVRERVVCDKVVCERLCVCVTETQRGERVVC